MKYSVFFVVNYRTVIGGVFLFIRINVQVVKIFKLTTH